jgi:hypothetical protein
VNVNGVRKLTLSSAPTRVQDKRLRRIASEWGKSGARANAARMQQAVERLLQKTGAKECESTY